jgi:alkylated DNA repair dioxygenase AlkB
MISPDIAFYPNFLDLTYAQNLFGLLVSSTPWRQDTIVLFGKPVLQPRLVAFYADEGVRYAYSGHNLPQTNWTQELIALKANIEDFCDHSFNSVLCNLYRTGDDSMGWHSDDEKSLGRKPYITSVSLGEDRTILFRNKKQKCPSQKLVLTHGSLLVMRGSCQHDYQHCIPKTKQTIGPRVNLTFRHVVL